MNSRKPSDITQQTGNYLQGKDLRVEDLWEGYEGMDVLRQGLMSCLLACTGSPVLHKDSEVQLEVLLNLSHLPRDCCKFVSRLACKCLQDLAPRVVFV